MSLETSRMTSCISKKHTFGWPWGYPDSTCPTSGIPVCCKRYSWNVRTRKTIVKSGKALSSPSTWFSSSDRSQCRMATHPQSDTQSTLLREIEGVLEVRTMGLGVTESALDVFSNFVQHIATNVASTSEVTVNVQRSIAVPRRSSRFAERQEPKAPCPPTVPTPPPPAAGTIPSPRVATRWALGLGSLRGYRSRPNSTGLGAREWLWVHPTRPLFWGCATSETSSPCSCGCPRGIRGAAARSRCLIA